MSTSSRRIRFNIWDAQDGAYLASTEVADGCGLAPDGAPGGFVISNGAFGLWHFSTVDGSLTGLSGNAEPVARWDNHLTRVML